MSEDSPSHVIVLGAGPLGRAATRHLVDSSYRVTVVTRSGTGVEGAEAIEGDVISPELPARLPPACAVVACVNFGYGAWQKYWPPAIEAMLALAETVSESQPAAFVLAGNLYGYAAPTAPMKETDPLNPPSLNGRVRKQVWETVMAAHDAGRVRAVEIRGSDYIGPGAGALPHGGDRLFRPILANKAAHPVGDPDAPHSWTAIDDFGRLLARAAHDPALAGRAWHVPTEPPLSIRDLARTIAHAAGLTGDPRISPVPTWAFRLMGVAWPMAARLAELAYQFEHEFVIDDTDARTLLGESSTPIARTVADTVESYRELQRT